MNAVEKLKQLLVYRITRVRWDDLTALEAEWDRLREQEPDWLCDMRNEMRGGECETHLPSPFSRHYESREVAAQMLDGSWVGWTYWYGGGKHGEPKAIEWMGLAYDVTMTEVLEPVRKFSRVEG